MAIELYQPNAKGAFNDAKINPSLSASTGTAKARVASSVAGLAKDYKQKLEKAYIESEVSSRLAQMQSALVEWDSQQTEFVNGGVNLTYAADWQNKYNELSEVVLEDVQSEALREELTRRLEQSKASMIGGVLKKGVVWEHNGLRNMANNSINMNLQAASDSPDNAALYRSQAINTLNGLVESGLISKEDFNTQLGKFDKALIIGSLDRMTREGDVDGLKEFAAGIEKSRGVFTEAEAVKYARSAQASIATIEYIDKAESQEAFLAAKRQIISGIMTNKVGEADIIGLKEAFPEYGQEISSIEIAFDKEKIKRQETAQKRIYGSYFMTGELPFLNVNDKAATEAIDLHVASLTTQEEQVSALETSLNMGYYPTPFKNSVLTGILSNDPNVLVGAIDSYSRAKKINSAALGFSKEEAALLESASNILKYTTPKDAILKIEGLRNITKADKDKLRSVYSADRANDRSIIDVYMNKNLDGIKGKMRHEFRYLVEDLFLSTGGDLKAAKDTALQLFNQQTQKSEINDGRYTYHSLESKVDVDLAKEWLELTAKSVGDIPMGVEYQYGVDDVSFQGEPSYFLRYKDKDGVVHNALTRGGMKVYLQKEDLHFLQKQREAERIKARSVEFLDNWISP